MTNKITSLFVKLRNFVRRNYIFALSIFFIWVGLDEYPTSSNIYGLSEVEGAGLRLLVGLQTVASSIFVGAGLICLTLNAKNNHD
jgi:hypothetical protein